MKRTGHGRICVRGLLLVAYFWASPHISAAEITPGPIDAEVIQVIDGDTLAVRAHVWPGQVAETHVRLAGVDAPELHGKCAAESALAERAKARTMLLAGGTVRLSHVRFDKYGGRMVARVQVPDGDLSELLVQAGLARRTDGRHRMNWCG